MLRSVLRLLAGKTQQPTPCPRGEDQIVLYAHVENGVSDPPRPVMVNATSPRGQVLGSHRERIYSMRLEHTKLCSGKRCERLRRLGIMTAGDLARANPQRLAMHFGAPRKALAVLKQYRRAIRFAASVSGMMPRDAILLINIHRRSARGLAAESPAALHRDLERFAESTKGRLHLRGRRIPSTRRLRQWITLCETCGSHAPLNARVA